MKRIFSFLLAAVLLLGLAPVHTRAQQTVTAALPGMGAYIAAKAEAQTAFQNVSFSYASFFYKDLTLFENTKIEYINVFVNAVQAVDDAQYMTVFLIDSGTAQVKETHRFYARAEDLGSTAPKKVLSLYCPEEVTVGVGETLMFSANGDPLTWGFLSNGADAPQELRGFWDQSGFINPGISAVLCIDVYASDYDKPMPPKPVLPEADTSGYALLPGMGDYIAGYSGFANVNFSYSAFTYKDPSIFEGTQIHHINVFANGVKAVDDDQYMTVYVVDNRTAQVISTHRFYAMAEALGSLAPRRVVSLYPREEIHVDQGQTLMFSANGDPLTWGYSSNGAGASQELKGFWYKSGFTGADNTGVLCIDVYATQAPPLPAEQQALQALLGGKTLSVFGDSISTFSGWSNSTAANSTLGANAVFYDRADRLASVDQTWWKQTADYCGMEVLVNNSWSGSSVTSIRSSYGLTSYGWNIRPGNLHDNTLENNPDGEPILPDVILLYMGTNDLMDGVSCGTAELDEAFFARIEAEGFAPAARTNFEEACALMVYKVRQSYPNADIFCCNNPTMRTGTAANRAAYNQVFQAVAQRYGCTVVDLYGSPISSYSGYTIDGIHPNAAGMDVMTDAVIHAMTHCYGLAPAGVEGRQDATCTTPGYTGDSICMECGQLLVPGQEIPAGHHWADPNANPRVCTLCNLEEASEVCIGDTRYETLAGAIAAAQPGDTVRLLTNCTTGDLVLVNQITLDLDLYTLETGALIATNGCRVTGAPNIARLAIDGEGLLPREPYVDADGFTVVPVYDPAAGSYRFSRIRVNTLGPNRGLQVSADEVYFQFMVDTTRAVRLDLMTDGIADNQLTYAVRLSWQTEEGTFYRDFTYSDALVAQAYTRGGDFFLRLTGLESLNIDLQTLTVQALVITGLGAEVPGTCYTQS